MRVVSENTPNAKAGEGKGFMISHIFETVGNGGKIYIRHISGLKYLHSILDISTKGQWRFTSYADTTYIDDGTLIEPINRKTDSIESLDSDFYHTPTINVLGTPRLTFMFGSGENPSQATTSSFGDDIESIFAPGADVLVELENMGNDTRYCSLFFSVHEEE